jgi:helicase
MVKSRNVADLPVHPGVKELVAQEIPELYEVQRAALDHTLSGDSLVLAIPTASGKSLVAYLTILDRAMKGAKALYIVPLRALAQEKYDDLKRFETLGLKVGMSIRDFDSKDTRLNRLDILVATAEKADALIRQGSEFMRDVDVVVADEVHLMNDSHRGPTVEVLLSWFKKRKVQVIALSATIANSEEIAKWLGARHVWSEWRPVTLKRGVFFGGEMRLHTTVSGAEGVVENSGQTRLAVKEEPEVEVRKVKRRGTPLASLVLDSLDGGGQCLVFVNTRKSAETQAVDLAKAVGASISLEDRKKLLEIARKIVDREEPTQQCHKLAEAMQGGVAFHHAGLVDFQRRLVEQNFKSKLIKVISATPTLASGINAPARRVIVRDVTRYDVEEGRSAPIPVMEVQQMCGRAGRPQYDRVGEAVLIARNEDQVEDLEERYILAGPEEIDSKLASEQALRVHLLAQVSIERQLTEDSLWEFIDSTFYAHTMPVATIKKQVERVLDFLTAPGPAGKPFMERFDGKFRVTRIGQLTSDLYLDPLSVKRMLSYLDRATDTTSPVAFLHLVSCATEMPGMYLRGEERETLEGVAEDEGLLVPHPIEVSNEEYVRAWSASKHAVRDLQSEEEVYYSALRNALMLSAWADESKEESIVSRFTVGPGDIRSRADIAEWLLYSLSRLAPEVTQKARRPLERMMIRVRYGVREELVDLVSLPRIGRVRARALHASGFIGLKEVGGASEADLAKVFGIGPATAKSIKEAALRAYSG